VLSESVDRFNWVIHAYCLMDNHYHLLIENAGRQSVARHAAVEWVYTQRFNRRHKRVGHVFQGRYKAIIVQKDSYLLDWRAYIVLNPVRAEMVRSAREWPWSSYRATADMAPGPEWLAVDTLLSAFGTAQSAGGGGLPCFCRRRKNQPSPWAKLKNQIYLGSDAFVNHMQHKVDMEQDLSEVPAAHRRQMAKPLEYYAASMRTETRPLHKPMPAGATE